MSNASYVLSVYAPFRVMGGRMSTKEEARPTSAKPHSDVRFESQTKQQPNSVSSPNAGRAGRAAVIAAVVSANTQQQLEI